MKRLILASLFLLTLLLGAYFLNQYWIHRYDGLIARQAAESSLRSELNGAVTAMLLSCELALQVPDLPAPAQDKMRTVHECARQLRTRLGLTA